MQKVQSGPLCLRSVVLLSALTWQPRQMYIVDSLTVWLIFLKKLVLMPPYLCKTHKERLNHCDWVVTVLTRWLRSPPSQSKAFVDLWCASPKFDQGTLAKPLMWCHQCVPKITPCVSIMQCCWAFMPASILMYLTISYIVNGEFSLKE